MCDCSECNINEHSEIHSFTEGKKRGRQNYYLGYVKVFLRGRQRNKSDGSAS